MAPNNHPISVNTLGMISEQGAQLIEQMSKLNQHFESFNAATPLGQMAGQKRVLENEAPTLRGGVSDNASVADRLMNTNARWDVPDLSQVRTSGVSDNASTAPDVPQGIFRRLSQARSPRQMIEELNSGQSVRPTIPNDMEVPGMRGLSLQSIQNEPFELPRFGEFTMQDKAAMIRDWTGRLAISSQLRAGGTSTATSMAMGNISGMANVVAENAAQIYAAQSLSRGITSVGQGMSQRGANLGYDTSGGEINIPGTNIGFRPPWRLLPGFMGGSDAANEGWRQTLTSIRLSTRAGINRDQAQELVQGLAQHGYSGDLNESLATGSLAELIQHGQRPEDFIPVVDQAIRLNTTDIDSVTDALKGLGDVARATHQNLTQATQEMAAYAQAAQEAGATYQQGMTSSNYFVGATGLNAGFGAQMLQNPLVQGLGMQQFGMLPSQTGLLPGGAIAGLTEQAAQMAMNLARPVAQDEVIQTPGGEVRISGRERQIAQAASSLGVTPEQMKRLVDNPDQLRRAGTIQTMLQGQQQNINDSRRGRTRTVPTELPRSIEDYRGDLEKFVRDGVVNPDWGRKWRESDIEPSIEKYQRKYGQKEITDPLNEQQRAALTSLRSTNDNVQSTSEIMSQMEKMDLTREDRASLKRLENDPQRFHDKAQDIITKQLDVYNDRTPDVYIGFKGDAARYFKQLDRNGRDISKREANAGGAAANRNAVSNMTSTQATQAILGGGG